MNHKTQQPYHGSCLCGSIQFEATNLSPQMAHCHCSMCRKFHGAAFATFGETTLDNFRWLQGSELLKSYMAPNGTTRQFCSECGSSLIFKPNGEDNGLVEFALGALDDPINERPDSHIFTAYKADWMELTDELPKFKEGRNG
jgi:hypothetical protein